jgi:hypothetical protein
MIKEIKYLSLYYYNINFLNGYCSNSLCLNIDYFFILKIPYLDVENLFLF